jgi:triacylglycerol lipase
MNHPPLVMIHGLWNTPRLFHRLLNQLDGQRKLLLIPHLPHGLGHLPLEVLAAHLDTEIRQALGDHGPLDLLGFSMGGLLARSWIHHHGGHQRTRRFVCVGSPQQGTLAAQAVPRRWLPSIADMKVGSRYLSQLAAAHRQHPEHLGRIDCRSFTCRVDLLVIPSWQGVLPVGPAQHLNVPHHLALMTHPKAVAAITASLLEPPAAP